MKTLTNKDIKRKTDNKMRVYGQTEWSKSGKVSIKINKKRNKKSGRRGELIDTIVHEEMHARHPKMYERTVRKKTKRYVQHMGARRKALVYARFRG